MDKAGSNLTKGSPSAHEGPMIRVLDLVKTYGKKADIRAVDHVSLTVERGEIFGLIGPDGAGKTTLFRILATLLLPDEGSATVNGHDVVGDYRRLRHMLGYMPGRFSLYGDLSVEENLHFFATLFNTSVKDNYPLISDIYSQLERFKDRRAAKLSGGMKQKLALCCALVHKPRVLLLDEPTTGVDPVSRREFWEMLGRLKAQDITIVVSTPYMDEAVRCDRVALMQKGRVLSIDTPQGIIDAYPDDLFAVRADDMHTLLREMAAFDRKSLSYAFGEYAHLTAERGRLDAPGIANYLVSQGIKGTEVKVVAPTIEDCFIKLLSD